MMMLFFCRCLRVSVLVVSLVSLVVVHDRLSCGVGIHDSGVGDVIKYVFVFVDVDAAVTCVVVCIDFQHDVCVAIDDIVCVFDADVLDNFNVDVVVVVIIVVSIYLVGVACCDGDVVFVVVVWICVVTISTLNTTSTTTTLLTTAAVNITIQRTTTVSQTNVKINGDTKHN